jgi:uncharacterized cupredoxin-like copper-binding protein
MKRLAQLAPLAVAVLLAGCGSSSSSSSTAAPAAAAGSSSTPASTSSGGGQVSLSETQFKIAPASPSVASTGTITITAKNSGTITHALAVQTPSGVVRTGPIAPGATATLKVNASKAGRYTFFCPIDGHRQLGMQGVLFVGSASASGASTGGTATSSSGGSGVAKGGSSGY